MGFWGAHAPSRVLLGAPPNSLPPESWGRRQTLAGTTSLRHGPVVRAIKQSVYKEPPYDGAQCFNVDVSSFGDTIEEAVANLKEALELSCEDGAESQSVDEVLMGESEVNA